MPEVGQLVQFVSLAIGFSGFAFALWSRRRAAGRLVYTFKATKLHSRRHPDVEILFRGTPVESLHFVQVALWNGGGKEIRAADLPDEGGPELVFPSGCRVLSVDVRETSGSLGAKIETVENRAEVASVMFDCLNPGEGVGGELLVAGSSDEETENLSMTMQGSIRGASSLSGFRWSGAGIIGPLLVLSMGLASGAIALLCAERAVTKDNGDLWLPVVLFAFLFWHLMSEAIAELRGLTVPRELRPPQPERP